jgi:hypothetical protein
MPFHLPTLDHDLYQDPERQRKSKTKISEKGHSSAFFSVQLQVIDYRKNINIAKLAFLPAPIVCREVTTLVKEKYACRA